MAVDSISVGTMLQKQSDASCTVARVCNVKRCTVTAVDRADGCAMLQKEHDAFFRHLGMQSAATFHQVH